jgi:transcriptional regulator with XRE-family HTH domain
MSQKEFAQKLGISQRVVADIERGSKEPSRAVSMAFSYKCHIGLKIGFFQVILSRNPWKTIYFES